MFATQALRRPTFTPADVRQWASTLYGLALTELEELSSFQDQNFKVVDAAGAAYIFRVDNPGWPVSALDLQNQAMAHLAAADPGLPIARLIASRTGAVMPRAAQADTAYPVRLFSFLPGRILARAGAVSPALAADFGRIAGRLSRLLAEFAHPGTERHSQWDFKYAPQVVREFLPFVAEADLRAEVEAALHGFEAAAGPLLPVLRQSFVHGDLTAYNVLVDRAAGGEWAVSGVVDFGDMTRSYNLSELAVVLAESVMGRAADPLAAAAAAVRAYHTAYPLTEAELAVLYHFLCIRMAVTITSECQQLSLEPDNAYVREVLALDRRMLRTLLALHPDHAQAVFRVACDLPAHPQAAAVGRWLAAHPEACRPLLPEAGGPALDLTAAADHWEAGNWLPDQPARIRAAIAAQLQAGRGLGRYGEARLLHTQADAADSPATLHLGVDVFAPAGTPVTAPLAGVVAASLPDGLLLRHAPADGPVFFSRLGGLAPVAGLPPEAAVAAGQVVGAVAEPGSASPLPAHAHFQLGCAPVDNLPGRVRAEADGRAVWLGLCPDPNLVLRLPGLAPTPHTAAAAVAERRFRTIPRSQEFYFDQAPVQIVRGWRQYLIDAEGRSYLDCINNVAHVGHSHPHVAAAVHRQMRRLNTNSRFLYDSMMRYSERLTALLPEPLRVVFFVCSGSEANDLALRLARAYTGQQDVIVIDGEYHGNTTATYEISTSLLDNPAEGKANREHIHLAAQPNLFRGRYRFGDPEAGAKYAASVQAAIDDIRARGRAPAAFFTEALLGSSGGIDLPAGYLPAVYGAVRAAGGVCISDEVQVGFGRVGAHFWAFQAQGVVPDIVTLGKPMGNGHPVSAVVTTPAIAEAFAAKATYFNTFGGNPVACEAGLAVLEVMEAEGLQANALEVGRYFKAGLTALMARHPAIAAVYGLGLYMGVELVRDRTTSEPATAEAMRLAQHLKTRGLIVYPTGDYYNILKLKPPLVFTRANADFFIDQLDAALTEAAE